MLGIIITKKNELRKKKQVDPHAQEAQSLVGKRKSMMTMVLTYCLLSEVRRHYECLWPSSRRRDLGFIACDTRQKMV